MPKLCLTTSNAKAEMLKFEDTNYVKYIDETTHFEFLLFKGLSISNLGDMIRARELYMPNVSIRCYHFTK
jgi:hypothetical protein